MAGDGSVRLEPQLVRQQHATQQLFEVGAHVPPRALVAEELREVQVAGTGLAVAELQQHPGRGEHAPAVAIAVEAPGAAGEMALGGLQALRLVDLDAGPLRQVVRHRFPGAHVVAVIPGRELRAPKPAAGLREVGLEAPRPATCPAL